MRKALPKAVPVFSTGNSSQFTQPESKSCWLTLMRPPGRRIEEASGLSRSDIELVGNIYAKAERAIINYGMGITQHRHGTGNVQQIANLLMLRGNIGRQGAGISPLRGHSNVQGDRTVGITEIPSDALLNALARVFGFEPPRNKGHNAIEAIEAIRDGRSKALVCLGGNLAVAMADPEVTFKAMRSLDLAVHIATKLNRSHLLAAKQSFLLPCLGRTEIDLQATGPQSITVEDSMSMVHASRGGLKPASEHLKSEPAIIAAMARATLPDTRVKWAELVSDYGKIRDGIEAIFPEFAEFNARIKKPGGFRLYVAASERDWRTPTEKANFIVYPGLDEDPHVADHEALTLATIRSHDQYNTTIYGMNDRYRGITGRRDVVFVNERDLASRGLKHGDLVDIAVVPDPGSKPGKRVMQKLTAVAYNIAQGSIATYYPEANVLVALDHYDAKCGTPSYKSIPVLISASRS
jgi:molybdopterin-dependent oxidoreductase alpha subunit